MAIDVSSLTDYTAAQLKTVAKWGMVQRAVGGADLRMPDGRSIGRATQAECEALYRYATELEAAENSNGGGIALVKFGEPR